MSAPFGTPRAIRRDRVAPLPPAMWREAALMLLDMGLTEAAARRHLGLDAAAFDRLANVALPPFRRGGELAMPGDNK